MAMPADTLLELCRGFQDIGVDVWVDGGWGVDALLGEETRPHDDVDVVIEHAQLGRLVRFLKRRGYRHVPRDDTRACNFVLGDAGGNEVDIHVIRIDGKGDGVYGPPGSGEAYPAYALTGRGTILGCEVRCMALDYQLVNHSGYPLRDKDLHDIARLCRRFGRSLPREYVGGV